MFWKGRYAKKRGMNKKTHKREDYKSKGFPQCCRSEVPGSRCVRPATTGSVVPITYRLKMHGRPLPGGDLALASSQFKLTTEWNFRALYRSRERKRVDDGLPVRKSELNVKITFIGADWPPCVGSRTYIHMYDGRWIVFRSPLCLCGESVVENVNFEG